jgi:hypothetical protein
LSDYATTVVHGNTTELEQVLFRNMIDSLDVNEYSDKRCVVKGCSNLPVPQSAYTHLVSRLRPVAKSIMFGEPCSTVPVYKRS